ncbi:hypothetical protein UPYG_G00303690 [Umbra pygmaea]|uniref:NADH dehydrogenase [ubiquinone] 1 beta subcomplex subunit 3 n=1 Tax=Umbra pygmaea TaxID=75934 RepID=A0ABD0WNC6_UMBPY
MKWPQKCCRTSEGFVVILLPQQRSQTDRMGGDHGHGSKMHIPDYKQWKTEGTPLEFTQRRLAARGLSDPWARNEAWRFMGGFSQPVTLGNVLLRGFKWGFAAFAVALAVEYTLFPPKKSDH